MPLIANKGILLFIILVSLGINPEQEITPPKSLLLYNEILFDKIAPYEKPPM